MIYRFHLSNWTTMNMSKGAVQVSGGKNGPKSRLYLGKMGSMCILPRYYTKCQLVPLDSGQFSPETWTSPSCNFQSWGLSLYTLRMPLSRIGILLILELVELLTWKEMRITGAEVAWYWYLRPFCKSGSRYVLSFIIILLCKNLVSKAVTEWTYKLLSPSV